jgi:hypothetical protein
VRTACLSTGVKKRDNSFEQFAAAAAIIKLDFLMFAVRRQSVFTVVSILAVQSILKTRKFSPLDNATLSDIQQ